MQDKQQNKQDKMDRDELLKQNGFSGTENIPYLHKDESVETKIDFKGSAKTQKAMLEQQQKKIEVETALEYRTKALRGKADKDLAEYGKVNGMRSNLNEDYGSNEEFNEVAYSDKPVKASVLMAEPEVELLGYAVMERLMPKGIGTSTAANVTDMINERILKTNIHLQEHFRDNCISWIDSVKGTRYSAKQYLDAVTYVMHRMAGDSQVRAYTKTFPERITRMERDGISMNNLNNYVSAFNNSKLVTEVYTQAMVPTHIMYNDYFHKAILTQVEIMSDTKVSAKVRSDAATSLMQHLKSPEIKKAEVSISLNESDTISQLRDAMSELAQAQKDSIDRGNNLIIDIAAAEIVKDEND